MKLTDAEIIAIRRWMDVIEPITDYTKPWADTMRFARVIESCAHMQTGAPTCLDNMPCMMPDDCPARGYCIVASAKP